MMSLLRSKFTIIGIIVVVLFGAWYGFTSSSAPASVLSSTTPDTSTGDEAIVSTLIQLQSITLSGAIFSNPAFASLQDYTTAITQEPAGRPDPFAPLVSGTTTVVGSTKSAQIFQRGH
jgi:hypothetical protein